MVTPDPMQLTVKVLLVQSDASTWTADSHPDFEGKTVPRRLPPEQEGSVTVRYDTHLRLRSGGQWRSLGVVVARTFTGRTLDGSIRRGDRSDELGSYPLDTSSSLAKAGRTRHAYFPLSRRPVASGFCQFASALHHAGCACASENGRADRGCR